MSALPPSRRDFLQTSSALVSLGGGLLPVAAESPATQVFYDPATLRHEPGGDHPESPKRLVAVMDSGRTVERPGRLSGGRPPPATEGPGCLGPHPPSPGKGRARGAGRT